jgi:CRISPR/Cas system-associated exonuclease Cas4 (RecB family)
VLEGSLRAPWKWERLLVESSVIGGRDRWSRRLAGLGAEMRIRIAELRQEEPESPRAAGLERDAANLEHLQRFALPVIERLAGLPGRATWGEWIAELERLAPTVLRRPDRVLSLLAELRGLGPVGPVALDEVRDVLAEHLATVAERPPAARYGRVFVGALEHARGRAFDTVFIPGLAERMFPQKLREDPILLDALRQQVEADLATQGDRAQHERLLLRLAVGSATRRVYLSYSRIELAEARPRVPSFYAMEVQRALAGRIPDPQTLERLANDAARARLAWPAPDDPARAIDPVEHDLASLGAILRLPPAEARGRARYLLELNDRLARSLRTRWARWRSRFSAYDGIVQLAPGTRDALFASRPNARAYSVSALQRFAACPYQFYLSAICRLEPREDIAGLDRLDPLTRGSLFHEVQAACLRTLQSAGALPLSAETAGPALAVLDRTLDAVAAAYREQLAPAIERVWQDEIESLRVDLRTWLEKSIEAQAHWEPWAFELAFGLPGGPGRDARSIREEVTLAGGWRLRGIVDLIERRRGAPGFRVTDHKTGVNRTASGLVVGRGEALQPVLYGLAVEQITGQPVIESRLSYCTRTGEFSERVVAMGEAARRRGLEVLDLIDRAIARGFLPPAPRAKACATCDFRPVCGPGEERRVAEKDPRTLADLEALRSWA